MKKNGLIYGSIIVIAIVITLINIVFKNDYFIYTNDTISYEKATVLEVLSENIQESGDYDGYVLGTQQLSVKFKSGDLKGEIIEVRNSMSQTHNISVKKGGNIIIKADRPENVTPYYTVYSYDRTSGVVTIAIIFIMAMILIARAKGFKSVVGLLMSLYIIGGFLIPAIYRGWSPIFMTIISVLLISFVSLVLINGFCEKTYTAIISTVLGVCLSAIFFFIFQKILNVTGYNLDEAESLIIISRSTGIKIKEIFFSAVLISSLGAVIDTSMSIASSIYEIREVSPDIHKTQLIKSGITIGQDMIGTMCQTLVLAFVGSSIATLLVMISYGTQFNQFLSSNYVALELVQAVSGSMAIIFTVPITSYLSTATHNFTNI